MNGKGGGKGLGGGLSRSVEESRRGSLVFSSLAGWRGHALPWGLGPTSADGSCVGDSGSPPSTPYPFRHDFVLDCLHWGGVGWGAGTWGLDEPLYPF